MPGIASYYGKGTPLNIYFNVTRLNDFEVEHANPKMSSKTTLYLEFWAGTAPGIWEKAAAMTLVDIDFAFFANVYNMDIAISIDKINIDAVVANYCQFGTLHPATIKLKLNNGFRLFEPILNKFLGNHHITFPSQIGPYF